MENLEALNPGRITEFSQRQCWDRFHWPKSGRTGTWSQSTLAEQRYFSFGKKQCGVVRALLAKVAGSRLARITRLVRSYRQGGEMRVHAEARRRFPVKYSTEDLELIEVDRAHQRRPGHPGSSSGSGRPVAGRNPRVWPRSRSRICTIFSVGYRQRAAEFTQFNPLPIAIG